MSVMSSGIGPVAPRPTAGATGPAEQSQPDLSAAIRQRLAGVSDDCRRLLQVGAVLSHSFPAEEVLAVLRLPVAALLQPLDEALRSGLLVVTDRALCFPDELARQEVLRTVAPPVARLLRQEVEAIRKRGRDAPAERDGGPLTAGELQIARLVARGLTNQQIAKRIFLSPHTVNYHLRQVFRKLAIGSRAELAALVHSEILSTATAAPGPAEERESGTSPDILTE